MRSILRAGLIALACLSADAVAQTTYPKIISPSTIVPPAGAAFTDSSGETRIASPTSPLPVTAVLPQITATSRSGLFGTTAAQLMPANPSRRFIQVQVQNSATCYISGLSTATADQNSLLLPGGGQLFESSTHVTTGAISIICTAASTPVYAREG